MWEQFFIWVSEPERQGLFLAIIIALGMGIIIGKGMRSTRLRVKPRPQKEDQAFLKGVQYILSNDHDHAIEEFTKSVQVNSDTIETYMALGNLYRSKGEIDRSIRIRQSIILRPNIDEQSTLRALFELGLDYRKGGLLNRALKTLQRVSQQKPSDVVTLQEIEKIYEELKDWEGAYQTRKKIARLAKGDHSHVLAHYLVEMGKVQQAGGDSHKAKSLFNKATATHKECVDAYLHLGDLHFSDREYKRAISSWKQAVEVAPQFTFLAYRRLEGAYSKMDNLKPVEEFLKECAQSNSDAFTHVALARYLYNENDIEGALREIDSALEMAPYFWEARRFKGEILLGQEKGKEALADYRELIQHLDVPYLRFQCSQCGFEPNDLQWQCPQCKNWDTVRLIDSAPPRSAPAVESGDVLGRLPENKEKE